MPMMMNGTFNVRFTANRSELRRRFHDHVVDWWCRARRGDVEG